MKLPTFVLFSLRGSVITSQYYSIHSLKMESAECVAKLFLMTPQGNREIFHGRETSKCSILTAFTPLVGMVGFDVIMRDDPVEFACSWREKFQAVHLTHMIDWPSFLWSEEVTVSISWDNYLSVYWSMITSSSLSSSSYLSLACQTPNSCLSH